MRSSALFLDRDGVVNVDTGYAYRPDQIRFVDHIFELARAATDRGYLIFVVTNQAGIGRGYYSEHDFHALSRWIAEQFATAGAPITQTYFCPHHPDQAIGAYRRACDCRKPAPGMLLQAAEAHDVDLASSLFVGDKQSDMEAGLRAGIGTLLYFGDEPNGALGVKVTSLKDVMAFLRASN